MDLFHEVPVAVEEYRPGPAHTREKSAWSSAAVTGSRTQLATTMPLAAVGQFGGLGGVGSERPGPRVKTARAVSPAPETSNTSLARVGIGYG